MTSRYAPPLAALALFAALSSVATAAAPPNVIIVLTDDQGYGDIGAHGNSMIQTPHLDALYGASVRLTDFHVDPTCAPTRSALMTGRYSTRTGVWHTIQGRSLMAPGELTLGEVFAANGYDTAMFGKWHLGDNYPLRPQDQGFATVLHHGGGGVSQTPDWWGNDYFDDVYRNGDDRPEQFTGYCTDVWFREATRFIGEHRESRKPFFCYLATNAAHGPYNVENRYRQPYLDAGVSEPMASFYGMITNIDENVGELMRRLDEWKLADKTILIFMTDNGTAAGVAGGRRAPRRANQTPGDEPRWAGFTGGMRGQKGSEYEGGHRVPFFIRWPGGDLQGGRDVETLAAHIDVLPTLVELCRINKPDGPAIDGRSLVSALHGEASQELRDRTLCVHSQRQEFVKKWKTSSVMTSRWRLVDGRELFDVKADPAQTSDVASAHPQEVQTLSAEYERWWESLSPVFDEYVRIGLGSDREPISRLTCHDWHTGDAPVPWNQQQVSRDPEANGFWAVDVLEPGEYEFTLRRRPAGEIAELTDGTARLRIGETEVETPTAAGDLSAVLRVSLPKGPARLQTWLDSSNGQSRGAYFVDVKRLAPR